MSPSTIAADAPPDAGPLQVAPDPEAVEFAASVRDLFDQHAGRETLRSAWDSPTGRIPGLWQRLAETGATGLVVPEEYGGVGLDLTAALPLLIESGRAALPEPLAATVAGAAILERAGGAIAERWLPAIAEGSATVGLAMRPDAVGLGAAWAALLLVAAADGSGVRAVENADALRRQVVSSDRGAGLAQLADELPGESVAGLTVDDALDIASVCVAAELVGLAEALLAMSVDYAKTRHQFGQPIGAFQAVKHHLADVYVAAAFARPVVAKATWSVTVRTPEASRDASQAMYLAGSAARQAARTALQVHGGIGYTYEHDLHMWQKRVWTLTSVLGDPVRHRCRVGMLLLDGPGRTG